MGIVIGDILPFAIGVTLSLMPIIAVILMLFSKNARRTSLGFLLGWVLGITVVMVLVVFVIAPLGQSTAGDTSSLTAFIRIILGLLLLYLAFRNWQKRPAPGQPDELPKWMSSIDSLTAGKALILGALLSGVNPKNLTLILGAGFALK